MKKVLLIVATIIFIAALCLFPYFLFLINRQLNMLLKIKIAFEDYIGFISAVPIGILAVVISCFALKISKRTDKREQEEKRLLINQAKRELRDYIGRICQLFFDIHSCTKSSIDVSENKKANEYIERLYASCELNEEDRICCIDVINYLEYARSNPDNLISIGQSFYATYLDSEGGFCNPKGVLKTVEGKLNIGDVKNVKKAK